MIMEDWVILISCDEKRVITNMVTMHMKSLRNNLKGTRRASYEMGLVWKERNLPLGDHKNGSLGRFKSLVRKLKRDSEIIQEQVQSKIIERVSNKGISNCKEFYLPHKPVIQEKLNPQSYELFMTLRRNLRQFFH